MYPFQMKGPLSGFPEHIISCSVIYLGTVVLILGISFWVRACTLI